MSLLGSGLGRALAGGGGAAADLANRYITEELATQRAQALADIQRTSATHQREDEDAFRNDPTRLARDRATKRDDVLAANSAAREAELAGLKDEPLVTARRESADAAAVDDTRRKVTGRKTELSELSQAEIDAYNAKVGGTTDVDVKRAGLMADAQARAQAKFREPKDPDPWAKLPAAVKLSVQNLQVEGKQISDAMVKAQADGNWDPEKNKAQAGLMVRHRAVNTRMQQLLAPYMEKGGAKPAQDDPLGLLGDSAPAQPKPAAAPAPAAKAAAPTPAEPPKPEWRPDPASPAGKQRALMEQANERRTSEKTQKADQARQEAERLLANGSRMDLYRFQGSDLFGLLDPSIRNRIAAKVNGG
jgi:hypothetical protein